MHGRSINFRLLKLHTPIHLCQDSNASNHARAVWLIFYNFCRRFLFFQLLGTTFAFVIHFPSANSVDGHTSVCYKALGSSGMIERRCEWLSVHSNVLCHRQDQASICHNGYWKRSLGPLSYWRSRAILTWDLLPQWRLFDSRRSRKQHTSTYLDTWVS